MVQDQRRESQIALISFDKPANFKEHIKNPKYSEQEPEPQNA